MPRLTGVPTLLLACCALAPAQTPPVQNLPGDLARAKMESIKKGHVEPGAVVRFPLEELNGYVLQELQTSVPPGIRNPFIMLGEDNIIANAVIDFVKVAQAAGNQIPDALAALMGGERPLKVYLHVESAHGQATVTVTRAELSGIPVTGSILNLAVEHFLQPLYPDAVINQPFNLNYNMERIAIHPNGVEIAMMIPPAAPSPPGPPADPAAIPGAQTSPAPAPSPTPVETPAAPEPPPAARPAGAPQPAP